MAEGILFNLADQIIGRLSSASVQEIGMVWRVKDELEELKDTTSTIKAVLLDAAAQQVHNHQVRNWVEKLEDAVSDVDNLLDCFSTEALQHQVMSTNKMATRVRTFFSSSNQVAFRLKMAHKIRDMKEELKKTAADRMQFKLEERFEETKVMNRVRETHSFMPEETVVGRDEDKTAILELLLDDNSEAKENLSVISIVGMGGIGKTALAQVVFNDKKVQDHFELRVWVCVSDDFDVKLLVEKIIKSATNETSLGKPQMDQLQKRLRVEINGKRFLLVLDDMWNENRQKWIGLRNLLMSGGKGSRIILTTRSDTVAKVAGTRQPYHLGILDEEKSWCLFKKMAFDQEQEPNDSSIVKTGIDIVQKCKGNPLAIRTVGSMLYFKNPKTEWPSFLEKEISRIPQEEDDILPTLKLSYDHLPSHLKHCFAYCSLFPKDYEIHVPTLVYQWMAQGFPMLSDKNQCLEDVGYDCFNNLLSRSFFQEAEVTLLGAVETCKMHDLMHDLAVLVAGKKCATISINNEYVDKKARHVSLDFDDDLSSQWKTPTSLVQAKKIQSILMPIQSRLPTTPRRLPMAFYDVVITKFKFLRTLSMQNLGIEIIPDSIGQLKHLRSLNLSRNENLKTLPNSISNLLNLQQLNLTACYKLEELPKDISKLISLRSLEIDFCESLTYMPSGLSQLTNLQVLSRLVLQKSTSSFKGQSAQLSELKNLNNLRKQLHIMNLKHGMESRSANFAEKRHLQSLGLFWEAHDSDAAAALSDEKTLEGIQSLSNLKNLGLIRYGGIGFPNWLPSSFTNLLNFNIHYCMNCKFLPPVDRFCSLKILGLVHLPALEFIMKNRDPATTLMPFLEELHLVDLPNLKSWWKKDVLNGKEPTITTSMAENHEPILPTFSCLSFLNVQNCPHLICMPLYPTLDKDLILRNTSWKPFMQTITNVAGLRISKTTTAHEASTSLTPFSRVSSVSFAPLSKLMHLSIMDNKDLQYLPDWLKTLCSLKILTIEHCPNLRSLCPGIQHIASLRELRIFDCKELDFSKGDMWQALLNLRILKLRGLPQLENLPVEIRQRTTLQYVEIEKCENFKLPTEAGLKIRII